MLITEDYVSFETAKLLKEKGFPQEYNIYNAMVYNEEDYEDEYEVQRMVTETKLVKAGTLSPYPASVPEPRCYCPTHQMAMKWLRSKGIVIVIKFEAGEVGINNIELNLNRFYWVIYPFYLGSNVYTTYEKASEEAIKYALTHKPFEFSRVN